MRSEPFLYRSWASVNLEQIVRNYKIYSSVIGNGGKIIPVVKANAYGHGDTEVAKVLEDCGTDFFAVSTVSEAVKLRIGGILGKILILGYTPPNLLYLLQDYDIIQTVVSESYAMELLKYAPKNAEFHVAVDTGMHRIGISSENIENTIKTVKSLSKSLKITGIFTHLSVAGSKKIEDVTFTESSIEKIVKICDALSELSLMYIHFLNSAGGLSYVNTPFNTVRLGISLYGYPPSKDISLPNGIAPALEWKSMVISVRWVNEGESIGYGRSFKCGRKMKIATVACGYADGYPRILSNKGAVIINGSFAKIVGNICMDMMMVDVTDVRDVKEGDTAVLMGKCGDVQISAEDLADLSNTISYEILTGISERVERIYIKK